MHKYFILLLVILIILIIIFTVIVYNELVTLRNAVTSSWKDLTKLIDEYMKLSGNDTDEYNKLIAVEDIIDYFYKVDSNDSKLVEIKEKIKVRDFINTSYDFCTGSHVGPDTIALFFIGKDRELAQS